MFYDLIYENDRGEILEFGTDEIKVNVLEGFGDVEADVQTERAPYQDGSTHLDTVLEERPIYIEFTLRAKNYGELSKLRRKMSRVFNPKLRGKFTVTIKNEDEEAENETFEIEGAPDSAPFFPDDGTDAIGKVQVGSIDWTAHDPYWRNPQEVSRTLRAFQGKFSFPFSFPVVFGSEDDNVILENEGDVEAPVTIQITGPVRRPSFINLTTNEHMTLNTVIQPNETLFIDTDPHRKIVEIHQGTDTIIPAMGWIDHSSDFWKLDIGENEIKHTADEGIAEAIAAIAWQNRFIGI